eukprot:6091152-Pyramimonas_sp.AAC.1
MNNAVGPQGHKVRASQAVKSLSFAPPLLLSYRPLSSPLPPCLVNAGSAGALEHTPRHQDDDHDTAQKLGEA